MCFVIDVKKFFCKYPIALLFVCFVFSFFNFSLDFFIGDRLESLTGDFFPIFDVFLTSVFTILFVYFFRLSFPFKFKLNISKEMEVDVCFVFSVVFALFMRSFSRALNKDVEFKSIVSIIVYILAVYINTFIKELLGRGIVTSFFAYIYAKDLVGIIKTLVLSSVVFAFVYFFDVFTVADLKSTLIYVFASFFVNAFFSVVYLRTRSIHLPSFIHFIFNLDDGFEEIFLQKFVPPDSFVGLYGGEGPYSLVLLLVLPVIYFLLILYFLRKNAIDEILKNVKLIRNSIEDG